MKKILKKIISIMLIVILLGSFEAPSIFQTVIAVSEYAATNIDRGDIFQRVFSTDELENIIPFSLENFRDNITKDYIINEFENAGETVTNKDELPNIIGTGTQIKTYFETYTILVYGDVDGSGTITVADAEKAFRHAIRGGNYTLTGIELIAANAVNTDEIVNVADAEYIFRFALGRVNVIPYVQPSYPTPTPTPTPEPTTPPTPPRPQVRLDVTAELEAKDKYYYVDEHKIVLKATRQDNGEKYTISSASATIKKDGKPVPISEAKITKKERQEDGSYVLTFVAQKAGTYTITAKVNSDEATPIEITIDENLNVSEATFGEEGKEITSLTLTTGQTNKEIPITFKNAQGITIIPSGTITVSPETTEGLSISLSDNKTKLIISATAETKAVDVNILVDGEVVGTIPVNVVAVINSIETIVNLGTDNNYYREGSYPVTIKLNGKEDTLSPDKMEWKVYNATTNRTTTDAKVTYNTETSTYNFVATKAGKYKVIATVKQDGLQPKVEEVLADKEVIEVVESNKVNKIIIGTGSNQVVITKESTTGKIEVYNGQPETILPITFKHRYSNGNEIDIENVIGNDIRIEGINDKVDVSKREEIPTNEAMSNPFKNISIRGTGKGEEEITLTIKANGEEVGTLIVSVLNPLLKVTPVRTPVEIYLGAAPSRNDLLPDEDEIFTFTLFEVSKVDKAGKQLGLIDITDVNKFKVAISDGEDQLSTILSLTQGFKDGERPNSGKITHLGISIDDLIPEDEYEATNTKVLNNLKANGGTVTISYEGLKTAENKEEYSYDIKVIKLVSEITSTVSKGTDSQYYREGKYPVSVELGENEGTPSPDQIEWKVYNADTGRTTTDAKVTYNTETSTYNFVATKAGKYKVIAAIKASGSQPRVEEVLADKEVIEVVESNKVNKIIIGTGSNQVVITKESTTGKIEVYNGQPETILPITFKHRYSNGNEIDIENVIGNDIRIEGINDKVDVSKREEIPTNEAMSNPFKNISIRGTGKGEEEITLTIKANGEEVGTLIVSVLNPLLKVTPVRTPVEIYLGAAPSRNDLLPDEDEIFTFTLFEVSKVDKAGKQLGLIDITDVNKFKVAISDGEDQLSTILSLTQGFKDGERPNSGKITHLGISIDDLIPEDEYEATNTKVLNNLKANGGTVTISYEGLKTVQDKAEYSYKIVVK